jgi:hypothetical protein
MQHLKFGVAVPQVKALVAVKWDIHHQVEHMAKEQQMLLRVNNTQFVRQVQLAVDKEETVKEVVIHTYVDQVHGVQERVEVEYYVQNVLCTELVIHVVE